MQPEGGKRNAYRLLMGKPEGKRPLGRSILILRWISRERLGTVWIGLVWLRIGTSGELL
jgi:hypothetical protein